MKTTTTTAQSDDKSKDLNREIRRLEAELKSTTRELDAAKREVGRLTKELEAMSTKYTDLVRSRRVTTDPGAGTPVSCIEDIGGEPDATTKANKR